MGSDEVIRRNNAACFPRIDSKWLCHSSTRSFARGSLTHDLILDEELEGVWLEMQSHEGKIAYLSNKHGKMRHLLNVNPGQKDAE